MNRLNHFLPLLFVAALLIAVSLAAPGPAAALDGAQPSLPLCLPGIYPQDPGDCAAYGPSQYLTQLAASGITLPIPPAPGSKPDFALTNTTTRYGEVRTRNAPVYGSMEDALANKKKNAVRKIDSSFAYISYYEDAVVDGKRVYQVEPGAWMTAVDISRIGAVPLFQGLTFNRTPERPFGWVLTYLTAGPVETKRTPGYEVQDYTGHFLTDHEVVWSFQAQVVGEMEWYLVAPDEWIPSSALARVIPNATPPQGVVGNRWIEVNLYEQTLAVYDQGQMVFATLIASGLDPFWTQPGVFQIYQKLDSTPMSGSFEADRSDAYYLEDVPWTMYYDKARALHGAYWRAKLGYPQSHGCVNLSVGDAHWLYDWANIGDWVYVWDPSGETPVDAAQYQSGGY